jgi:hypothetical protein
MKLSRAKYRYVVESAPGQGLTDEDRQKLLRVEKGCSGGLKKKKKKRQLSYDKVSKKFIVH